MDTKKPGACFARCTITHEEALPLFQSLPESMRTARGFAKHLQGLGHKISHVTVTRWFSRSEWIPLISSKSPAAIRSANAMASVVHRLAGQASFLSAAVYQGMQMAVLERICHAMPKIRVESADDFGKMLDACDRLRSMVHDARGDKFDLPEVKPPQVPATVTNLGSFKKTMTGNG